MPKELVRDFRAKLPTRGSLSHSSQQFLIQMYHLKNNNNVQKIFPILFKIEEKLVKNIA